jgi:hypothetical protein
MGSTRQTGGPVSSPETRRRLPKRIIGDHIFFGSG